MKDCIFCQMAQKKISCSRVYEDNRFLAFRDINPKAPVHILVIPKKHASDISEIKDVSLLGELLSVASKVAADEGVAETGYRLVINTNKDGGQTVNHVHVHVMGGRSMDWPPG